MAGPAPIMLGPHRVPSAKAPMSKYKPIAPRPAVPSSESAGSEGTEGTVTNSTEQNSALRQVKKRPSPVGEAQITPADRSIRACTETGQGSGGYVPGYPPSTPDMVAQQPVRPQVHKKQPISNGRMHRAPAKDGLRTLKPLQPQPDGVQWSAPGPAPQPVPGQPKLSPAPMYSPAPANAMRPTSFPSAPSVAPPCSVAQPPSCVPLNPTVNANTIAPAYAKPEPNNVSAGGSQTKEPEQLFVVDVPQLQQAYSTSADAVFVADTENRILWANNAYNQLVIAEQHRESLGADVGASPRPVPVPASEYLFKGSDGHTSRAVLWTVVRVPVAQQPAHSSDKPAAEKIAPPAVPPPQAVRQPTMPSHHFSAPHATTPPPGPSPSYPPPPAHPQIPPPQQAPAQMPHPQTIPQQPQVSVAAPSDPSTATPAPPAPSFPFASPQMPVASANPFAAAQAGLPPQYQYLFPGIVTPPQHMSPTEAASFFAALIGSIQSGLTTQGIPGAPSAPPAPTPSPHPPQQPMQAAAPPAPHVSAPQPPVAPHTAPAPPAPAAQGPPRFSSTPPPPQFHPGAPPSPPQMPSKPSAPAYQPPPLPLAPPQPQPQAEVQRPRSSSLVRPKATRARPVGSPLTAQPNSFNLSHPSSPELHAVPEPQLPPAKRQRPSSQRERKVKVTEASEAGPKSVAVKQEHLVDPASDTFEHKPLAAANHTAPKATKTGMRVSFSVGAPEMPVVTPKGRVRKLSQPEKIQSEEGQKLGSPSHLCSTQLQRVASERTLEASELLANLRSVI